MIEGSLIIQCGSDQSLQSLVASEFGLRHLLEVN